MRRIARGSWLSRRQASADLDENTPCGFYADRDRGTRPGAASEGHLVARLVNGDLCPHSVLDALKFVKATGNIPENINCAIKTGMLRDFVPWDA
jgi:hypothetical protein